MWHTFMVLATFCSGGPGRKEWSAPIVQGHWLWQTHWGTDTTCQSILLHWRALSASGVMHRFKNPRHTCKRSLWFAHDLGHLLSVYILLPGLCPPLPNIAPSKSRATCQSAAVFFYVASATGTQAERVTWSPAPSSSLCYRMSGHLDHPPHCGAHWSVCI